MPQAELKVSKVLEAGLDTLLKQEFRRDLICYLEIRSLYAGLLPTFFWAPSHRYQIEFLAYDWLHFRDDVQLAT